MKNSTKKAGNRTLRIDPEFDKALDQVAKLPPRTSEAIAADDKAFAAGEERLAQELARQVEANELLTLRASPQLPADTWRHVCYVAEREGVSFDEAVAHLLEEGVRLDSEARVQLRRE